MELLGATVKLIKDILVLIFIAFFLAKSLYSLYDNNIESICWAILFLVFTIYIIFS